MCVDKEYYVSFKWMSYVSTKFRILLWLYWLKIIEVPTKSMYLLRYVIVVIIGVSIR